MTRGPIFVLNGLCYYDPGDGILTQFMPQGGLNPSGLWVPLNTDAGGKLLVSNGGVPASVSTANLTAVPASTSSVPVLASNPMRSGAIFYNNSSAACFLAYAASSSSSLFTEFRERACRYRRGHL